ncbi:hypothetical protein PIB30_034473 [Stylosanthes scabra]|uniref:Uncharacterized protein n=1 Tax=Stylosanthes scabra TaxID=79078 RepID=A0ABU6VCW0_9FABA|nr:hypothetical protein [Stylosanthes scabra]
MAIDQLLCRCTIITPRPPPSCRWWPQPPPPLRPLLLLLLLRSFSLCSYPASSSNLLCRPLLSFPSPSPAASVVPATSRSLSTTASPCLVFKLANHRSAPFSPHFLRPAAAITPTVLRMFTPQDVVSHSSFSILFFPHFFNHPAPPIFLLLSDSQTCAGRPRRHCTHRTLILVAAPSALLCSSATGQPLSPLPLFWTMDFQYRFSHLHPLHSLFLLPEYAYAFSYVLLRYAGMLGVTVYAGFLNIGLPKKGDDASYAIKVH